MKFRSEIDNLHLIKEAHDYLVNKVGKITPRETVMMMIGIYLISEMVLGEGKKMPFDRKRTIDFIEKQLDLLDGSSINEQ